LTRLDLTLDCSNPAVLAGFWKAAAGYVDEPNGAVHSREEWSAQYADEFADGMGGAWLHDPSGVAPRLSLLQVPEPKIAKNGLRLDLRVSGQGTPDQKWSRVTDQVTRLSALGAVVLQEIAGHHVCDGRPRRQRVLRCLTCNSRPASTSPFR